MRRIILAVLVLATAACRTQQAHPERSVGIGKYPSARDLYRLAEVYRLKHKLPALGIGIVHRGQIVGLGMAGQRAANSTGRATLEDAFDVASCSKSVTATVAAMLVEQGIIHWDSSVSDVFPELRGVIHQGYAGVTLELLLRHQAGIGHELNRNSRWSGWQRQHSGSSAAEQRLRFVTAALQRPPRYPPGTATYYSSDGYVVAGSMLERAAGVAWEELAQTRLFQPLGLLSMRYGMLSPGGTAKPVSGHESGWFGLSLSIAPDPSQYGAHPFGAPAGFLYASVVDLLRYVDFHIQGDNGNGSLLPRASFQRLHATLEAGSSALGWVSEVKRDPQGKILEHSVFHGGYSGRFRANMWFTPETQWGTVIVMNHGRGDESISADIFFALLREFGLLPEF